MHGIHGIFLFQNSLFDCVKCARRNSRKRRGCAGLPCGISISHKFHEYLSLRDGFISHRLHRLHGFSPPDLTIRYLTASNVLCGFTQILSLRDGCLDILEELGRCAALDFVIPVFRQGMVAFGILICKDNNFF